MADEGGAPRPVPSLATTAPIDDEERNRYGQLLDRAAERGLIDPAEYEVRLRDLAQATTVEELRRIVTELPAFAAVPAPAGRGRTSGARRGMSAGPSGPPNGRRRSSPWLLLAVMVLVLAASLVLLGIFAAHLGHTRNSGVAPPVTAARVVSALRL